MYLYNRNKDKIEIYSMEPNDEKIEYYKHKEIAKIPTQQRVLRFETNLENSKLISKLNGDKGLILDVPKEEIDYCKSKFLLYKFHEIRTQTSSSSKLSEYYSLHDDGQNSNLIRVFEYNNKRFELEYLKYLLVLETYTKDDWNRKQSLNNVINLTEDLYLLELLLRGKFELLNNKNIQEQLSLFDISNKPIEIIDLEQLEKLKKYNLSEYSYDLTVNKVNESQKILKLVK